jgi:hypothetical protein
MVPLCQFNPFVSVGSVAYTAPEHDRAMASDARLLNVFALEVVLTYGSLQSWQHWTQTGWQHPESEEYRRLRHVELNPDSIEVQDDCKDRHASNPHRTAGDGGLTTK